MFEFTCPTCRKKVHGDDSIVGKYVLCPACNIAMTAPAATPRNVTAIATPEYLPPTKATQPVGSSEGAFSDGWPPVDATVPSVRKAVPHVLSRMAPVLIVIAILGTATFLLIPAVQPIRNKHVARTQSTQNLKQIGLAMHNFHDIHKKLPFNGTVPAKAGDATSGSWAFQILPDIDAQALFMNPDTITDVAAYMCPGRDRPLVSTTGAWSDYCINPFLNDPNGVINTPDAKRTFQGMPDGASNTILAGHGSIDPDLYSSQVAIPQSTDIFKGGDPATARRSTTDQRDKKGDASLTWGSPFPQGSLFVWCGLGVFLTPSGGERAVVPD